MSHTQISVERDGAVMVVTLDRPEKLNAWTWTMDAEIGEAFEEAESDDAVRAIVVTGAGRAFCAGADLSGGGGTFSGDGTALGRPERRGLRAAAYEMSTPVIAAVNGPAVGVGLTLATMWDFRVVAEDAKLGFVFNRRGVMPDADLLWLLPRMIGYGRAMDLLLTGRMFTGAEALDLGFAHRTAPAGQVLDVARELAQDIAANTAPVSVALTKRLLYDYLSVPDRQTAAKHQNRVFSWVAQQADSKEGVVAFLEKRPPRWALSKSGDLPRDLLDRE